MIWIVARATAIDALVGAVKIVRARGKQRPIYAPLEAGADMLLHTVQISELRVLLLILQGSVFVFVVGRGIRGDVLDVYSLKRDTSGNLSMPSSFFFSSYLLKISVEKIYACLACWMSQGNLNYSITVGRLSQ